MKRPMIYVLIYLIFGILTGQYLSGISIALFSVIIIASVIFLHYYYKWNKVYIFFVIYVLGILLIRHWENVPNQYDNKLVSIAGTITQLKKTSTGDTKMYIKTDTIDGKKQTLKIYIITVDKKNYSVSDIISANCKLQMLATNKNKGEYNEFLFEHSMNVCYKSFCNNLKIIGNNKDFKYYLWAFQKNISNNYDIIFPPTEAGIIKAVILGDKDTLDTHIMQIFKTGGIYHILAISGLHIGILCAFLFLVLNFIFHNKWANIITIIILVVYAILTGLGISTVRAVLMSSIFLLSAIVHRKNNGLNTTIVVATALLLYNPLYLFRVGFLLTFSAVLGILMITVALTKLMSKIKADSINPIFIGYRKIFLPYLAPTLAACIFTFPIITYFFYSIYPYTIVVNLLVGFTIPFFIILSFFVGIASIICMPVAKFIAFTVFYILKYYEEICNFFQQLPYSSYIVGQPSIYAIILYYCFIVSIIMFLALTKHIYKYICKLSAIGVLFITLTLYITGIVTDTLNVTLLNNMSNAIVLYNRGITIVVDSNSTHVNNCENYLQLIGKRKIDDVIVTKMDKQNTLNTMDFMTKHLVTNVYIPFDDYSNNAFYTQFVNVAHLNNVNLFEVPPKYTLSINKMKMTLDTNNFILLYKNTNLLYTNKIDGNNYQIPANIIIYDGVDTQIEDYIPNILISRTAFDTKKCKAIKVMEKGTTNIYMKLLNNNIKIERQ